VTSNGDPSWRGRRHGEQRVSTSSLADLARAGFEIARQPLMTVDFEIHHIANREGYLRELITDSDETTFLETLSSAANGVGAVIGTRTRGAQGSLYVASQQHGRHRFIEPEVEDGRWLFRQTAWPNPTFNYETARTYEALIAIDADADAMSNWHAQAIKEVTGEIAGVAAAVTTAPLLTLLSPAQLPPKAASHHNNLRYRREAVPPSSSSIAVRFSIALHEASAQQFFALSDRFRELCTERGYGLWLADSRPGHRAGNWFEVCKPVRRPSSGHSVPSPPVTCVGPARIGSTYTILSLLRHYPQVGVVSCCNSILDDLAFIHLQLSIEDVSAEQVNAVVAGARTLPNRPRDFLEKLFERLELRVGDDPQAHDELIGRASDYQTFAGPAFDYRPPSTTEWLGIWFSWQIARKEDGLSAPLECLYRALDRVAPNVAPRGQPAIPLSAVANVEYLMCRATERSVVQGVGKFSVPADVVRLFNGTDTEAPASRLCVAIEETWKVQVDEFPVVGLSELTVAWRESWLGHWTYS
jgi:hypothetical protein